MKRAPLERPRRPLAARPDAPGLARRKPLQAQPSLYNRMRGKGKLPAVNAARKAKRRAANKVYGEYHRWLSDEHWCILAGKPGHDCMGAVKGHHLKTVATGGEDYANEVPVCTRAHRQVESLGEVRFCGRWHLPNLHALAEHYARLWDARGHEEAA